MVDILNLVITKNIISKPVNKSNINKQELMFINILEKYNYKKLKKEFFNFSLMKDDKSSLYFNGKFFIHQPFSSQRPPDFIILYYGTVFFIELKSSKNRNKIVWNCSLPKENYIYIINNKNFCNIFLGKHFISKETFYNLKELKNNVKLFVSDNQISNPINSRHKWNYYSRSMFNHSFRITNEYLEKCYNETIEFVKTKTQSNL